MTRIGREIQTTHRFFGGNHEGQMNVKFPVAIETKALTRNFGDFCALDSLDLQIPHQCIFGLLGPNGAGKSTAIKILTTLLDCTSGSATVAGFDVATQPVEVRKHIGYVPQMLSADGALTAVENWTIS